MSGATLSCLSQSFKITLADFKEDTIGAIFTEKPLINFGNSIGIPAPEIIISAPPSMAALTCSL